MTLLKPILAGLAAASVFGCTSVGSSPDFKIRDSGLHAAHDLPIYWINDEEVLFAGPTGETRRRSDGADVPVNRVSVWNTRTNSVRRYAEITNGLCFHEGYVVFWQRDLAAKRSWVNFGKLGEESRVERNTQNSGEFYDGHTCRHHAELPTRPEWTKELGWRRLLPEHGFLITEQGFKNSPYSFCPVGSKERAECLPLEINQREVLGFTWYPFKTAYFAVGRFFRSVPQHPDGGFGESPWPAAVAMPVWWLYPDGRTELLKLPPGPWLNFFVFPTRVGMVTIGRRPSQFGHSLYLVKGEKGIPILDGLFRAGMSYGNLVSPNGCRMAVNHDPKPLETNAKNFKHVTLKVIDLCEGDRHGIQHR